MINFVKSQPLRACLLNILHDEGSTRNVLLLYTEYNGYIAEKHLCN